MAKKRMTLRELLEHFITDDNALSMQRPADFARNRLLFITGMAELAILQFRCDGQLTPRKSK